MSKILWDQVGDHLYETGTDHVVVYPAEANGSYPKGYGWNGVTGYTESPSGADETALYADNVKYLSLRSAEEFGATITAYTYPDEFAVLDGSAAPVEGVKIYQQARKSFGLAVRTLIGNDIDSNDHGYMLHLVYGLTASPSERAYSTVNDSPEAIEFSWELKSVPVSVNGYKPTSVITIDSTKFTGDPTDPTSKKAKLNALEAILYGTDGSITYTIKSDLEPTDNPSELGLYEKVGDTYVLTTDTEVASGKDYYEKNETGGADPRLPLPEEVIEKLRVSTGG